MRMIAMEFHGSIHGSTRTLGYEGLHPLRPRDRKWIAEHSIGHVSYSLSCADSVCKPFSRTSTCHWRSENSGHIIFDGIE